MRGLETVAMLLSQRAQPESSVPQAHPLRPIWKMADNALASLSGEFGQMYSCYATSISSSGDMIEVPGARDSFFDPEQT